MLLFNIKNVSEKLNNYHDISLLAYQNECASLLITLLTNVVIWRTNHLFITALIGYEKLRRFVSPDMLTVSERGEAFYFEN